MLDKEWLSTFVPAAVIEGASKWRPIGACVFVARHDLVWCVTALHVLPSDGKHFGVLVLVNGTRTLFDLTDLASRNEGMEWLTDSAHDISAVPMPTPPGIAIKAVSEKQTFLLEDVLPGMSCLTGGCPYGLPGLDPDTTTPVVMDGVVAGKDNASDRVFISTPTFQGNSGGPIFAIRSPFNAVGGAVIDRQIVGLSGIVLQVHTLQPSTAGAVPLRLGMGVGMRSVFALLDSPKSMEMAKALKSGGPTAAH